MPGNDIFVGGEGFDEMIGEGGDDIFVGSGAQDKMDGMSGFDWTTYKNDLFGVTVDMHPRCSLGRTAASSQPGVFSRSGHRPNRSSTVSPRSKDCRDRRQRHPAWR